MFHRQGSNISPVTKMVRPATGTRLSPVMMQAMRNIDLYEDDLLMRDLLREWLTQAGYHVSVADLRGGRSRGIADLVIASIYMPKQAGADFLQGIRAAHPETPIIAISGQFRSGLCEAGATARALGVQQVIAKPLVRSDLLESVRAMIGEAD
jgi:DNA-binding response OmpR family regulator